MKKTPAKKKAKRTASQSSKLAKQRGADYENEIAALLTQFMGVKVTRKLGQARDGGDDLQCGPLRIEAKRRRSIGWLNDALAQVNVACAGDPTRPYPMVVTREDGGASLVIMEFSQFLSLLGAAIAHGTELWD